MQSKATNVDDYLAGLPVDRREAIESIRAVILKNLPKGYEEGMQYGMIGYYVPHSIYPDGYHCDPKQPLPFASLASQKNHMALYMTCVYGDPELSDWFREAWKSAGKKLDAGKSCVRFKKLDDVPLKVVGQAIKKVPVKKFVDFYESVIKGGGGKRASKTSAKKTAVKKKAAPKKKTATKKKAAAKKKVATKKVAAKKTVSKKSPAKKAPAKKKQAKKRG